jgi:hypothetical protein
MDYFKVTHAWAEPCPISKFIRYKFRFEKLNFESDGWWASSESSDKDKEISGNAEISVASCMDCKSESPQVYQEGWMCMVANCRSFWKVSCFKFFYYIPLTDIL